MHARGCILSEDEYKVLKKYKRPDKVQDEDRDMIYNLVGRQLMALGFREGEGNHLEETVRLTPLGRRTLSRETTLRNPVVAPLYRFVGVMIS